MAIRINLLAEQQALEEARRRDPVKRAAIWSGILTSVILIWAGLLQFQIIQASKELGVIEERLKITEEDSKDFHAAWNTNGEIESRLALLDKYSTNRFFWASALNALQQTGMDHVRVMQLRSLHSYSINAEARYRTNLVEQLQPRSKWRFWEAKPALPDIASAAEAQLERVLQGPQFSRGQDLVSTKVQYSTNQSRLTAAIEVTRPPTASENISFSIEARDYSDQGRQVNEFLQNLFHFSYFQENLHKVEGQGVRLRERGIQAEEENNDTVYPERPFIRFTIDCRFEERVRAL
jgi:hypothetical protein